MSFSRRDAMRCLLGAGLIGSASSFSRAAYAETYEFDALGRLVRVTYPGGAVVQYVYDDAGNRTQVVYPGGSGFTATIAITGTGAVNLRTLANTAGYNGAQNANVTFTLANTVTLLGSSTGGDTLDTGVWPTGSYSITLALQVSGKIFGGGGRGGNGASSTLNATSGGAGGDAINCQAPISITVNAGGEVKGGGGGGGGGGGWSNGSQATGGGGGGGGFPNGMAGFGGGGLPFGDVYDGAPGSVGTAGGGGAGGAGGDPIGGVPTKTPGAGGAGGGAAANGVNGTAATPSSASGWTKRANGGFGAGGYAVRKNGNTVPVTNNGTITGTVG